MWPTRLAALVCALVCVLAPLSVVVVHIARSPSFSIVDEEAHFDYVQRISQGSIPRLGQELLPSTDHLLRCVAGRPPESFVSPPCNASPARVRAFERSEDNAQYEAQQPPLYYAATAVIRWPFIHLLHMGLLPGTRITGAVWLAAGLLLAWLAASLLGLELPLIAAGVLLLVAAPNVVSEASSVSNDSAAIFAGALTAVWGAMAWRRPGALPWWSFLLVGLIAALLKANFVLPVITVAGLLALDTWAAGGTTGLRKSIRSLPRAEIRRWLTSGGTMLIGSAIGLIGWAIVFHELSLVNPKTFAAYKLASDGQTGLADLANNALGVLFPLTNTTGYVYQWTTAGPVSSSWTMALANIEAQLIGLVVVAASTSWLFVKERRWSHWLGAVSLAVLFFGGWAIGISIMITYSYNTSLPGRYGLPMAVLLMLALMGAVTGRGARALLWALAVASFGLTFWFMLV
jgi:hypothetical protein